MATVSDLFTGLGLFTLAAISLGLLGSGLDFSEFLDSAVLPRLPLARLDLGLFTLEDLLGLIEF